MIFEGNGVSVDQHFVRSGGKSYAINKINSVEVRTKVRPGRRGWIFAWIFTALLLIVIIGMMSDGESPAVPVIIAIFLGAWGYRDFEKRHPITSHELFLMTSSSEVQAFATDDSDVVFELRDAIEQAMIGSAVAR